MFIEFHIDGLELPHIVEIGNKANHLAQELGKKGKKWRLGKVVY